MNNPIRTVILALAALVACGPADQALDEQQTIEQSNPGGNADTEAPYVINKQPAVGAKGIRTDAEIKVVFNKPMDADSVIAAFESKDVPADKLTFTFNDAKDTLTIKAIPGSGAFTYATGESFLVQPHAYAMFIGTGAKDLAGNALEDGIEVSFETARQLWLNCPILTQLSGSVTSQGAAILGYAAGDTSDDDGVRAAMSFSLENLASAEVLEVQKAELTTSLDFLAGQPFGLGMLLMEHVVFDSGAAAYGAGALGTPWVVATAFELDHVVLDVTAAVAGDMSAGEQRHYRSQYRVRFESQTDKDGVLDAVKLGTPLLNLRAMFLVK